MRATFWHRSHRRRRCRTIEGRSPPVAHATNISNCEHETMCPNCAVRARVQISARVRSQRYRTRPVQEKVRPKDPR